MNMKHTPGPWRTGDMSEDYVFAGDVIIAKAYRAETHGDLPSEANARLIAAAPELLMELDVLVGGLAMLRRAIEEGDPKREFLVRIDDMLRETRAAISKAQVQS